MNVFRLAPSLQSAVASRYNGETLTEKRRFRNRAIVLVLIWILLLVLSMSFLSILLSFFAHDPQGESISTESWAGYIISRTNNPKLQVTAINASWAVPTVNITAGGNYSSVWIGVGGQLDMTLIQVGTEQDVFDGKGDYYAWYELLPNFAVRIDTIPVSPGDIIVASLRLVDSNASRWNIQMSDLTTGQSFGTTVTYNSTGFSGEWILERPTVNNRLTTLADFGNVTFTGCYLDANSNSGPMKAFYFSRIEMTNSANVPLTSISSLVDGGSGFTVSYIP